MITEYLKTNWIEIVGAVLSLIYIFFSIREKSGLWIFGFLASAFYIVVFYESKLYADMSLQFYYLFVSVYGWINWHKKTNTSQKQTLTITRISNKRQVVEYVIGTLAVYLVYFIVLKFFTDSPIPIADSVVGALSIIGTWMLAKKKIENWVVWVIVDAFASGLYFYKHLYPTAVLLFIYTIMAVIGYFQWKKNMQKSEENITKSDSYSS